MMIKEVELWGRSSKGQNKKRAFQKPLLVFGITDLIMINPGF